MVPVSNAIGIFSHGGRIIMTGYAQKLLRKFILQCIFQTAMALYREEWGNYHENK